MDDGGAVTDIYSLATECHDLLAGSVSNPVLREQNWARSAQGDFNLWRAGIKADCSDKSSLDYRLRKRPDVRAAICSLLRGLAQALVNCQQVASTNSNSIVTENGPQATDFHLDRPQSPVSWEAMSNESSCSESLSENSPDPLMSESISYVQVILAQLERLSLAIRKSGSKYRFKRADKNLQEGNYDALRKFFTTVVMMGFEDPEARFLTTAKKIQRASDYDRLNQVQRCLVHANILRRNRIEYMTRSQASKSLRNSAPRRPEPVVQTGNAKASTSLPSADGQLALHPASPSVATQLSEQILTRKQASLETPTATPTIAPTATEVSSKLDIKPIFAKRSSSKATIMTRIGASQVYPRRPSFEKDGSLICPYCDEVLPSYFSQPEHESSWKSHVAQDIIPYTCIVDHCDTPNEMYLTATSLLSHMLEKHSVTCWRCDYCAHAMGGDNKSSEERLELFDTAEEWELHIAAKHADAIPPSQYVLLAELNKRPMIGPLSCPLCEFVTTFRTTEIDDHILEHLHEFALRSLPERTGEEGNEQKSKISHKSTQLSHTKRSDGEVTLTIEYPNVTLREIEDAVSNTWIFLTDGTGVALPILKEPLYSDAAAAEAWQTKARRLTGIVNTFQQLSEDGEEHKHLDWRDAVVKEIEEMNLAAVSSSNQPITDQTNSVHYTSLPPPISHVTGTNDILEALEDHLLYSRVTIGEQSRVALVGPRGTGKSTIACTFAHRLQDYNDYSVFWVDARTERGIEESYKAIAKELLSSDSSWGNSSSTWTQYLLHYLTWTFNGRWLLVMDGLQHQTALFLSQENSMPQGLKGSILFTTSNPGCLALLGPVKTIPIPEPSDDIIRYRLLRSLSVGDPVHYKRVTLEARGCLLQETLDNSIFQKWCLDSEKSLLWIKGGPGTGKTVLLGSLVDHLQKTISGSHNLSYFFCQLHRTDSNSAINVLRGLILLIINQQPSLISHVRKEYDLTGEIPFEDSSNLDTAFKIMVNIIQDTSLRNTYLIIEALDECTTDLSQLLKFIIGQSMMSSHVKWLVSSRTDHEISMCFKNTINGAVLTLELNSQTTSSAINDYIQHKIADLAAGGHYDDLTLNVLRHKLLERADSSFILVSLVFNELTDGWPLSSILGTIDDIPVSLDDLYSKALNKISISDDDAMLCKHILTTVSILYRPTTLEELAPLLEPRGPKALSNERLMKMIKNSSPFLTVNDATVNFSHQSAKDYILDNASDQIFSSRRIKEQQQIASRSIDSMSKTLGHNMYNFPYPGYILNDATAPDPDPIASIRYASVYWIEHLCEGNLLDDDTVVPFLTKYFLHWLEALSLIGSLSKGVSAIMKLVDMSTKLPSTSQLTRQPELFILAKDMHRFIVSYRGVIENTPLQVYCSALVFSPSRSLIRRLFEHEISQWITVLPVMEDEWSSCFLTLESDEASSYSFTFLKNGTRAVSGSLDHTVKIWDVDSGFCLKILKGHSSAVQTVAFFQDSGRVLSGSVDSTIKVWDIINDRCIRTFEGHMGPVNTATPSADDTFVVSGSDDCTIKIWDVTTGSCLTTLEAHNGPVYTASFSPDGLCVISGSEDRTIKIWDVTTGSCLTTFKDHSGPVYTASFSPDGLCVISGSEDRTIKIWDVTTGSCLTTLEDHSGPVYTASFSPDGAYAVSGSGDKTVKIWGINSGMKIKTLEGHRGLVCAVAFSFDGKFIVSASEDTMKVWDSGSSIFHKKVDRHTGTVHSVTLSPDSTVVASVSGNVVKIWDTLTSQCILVLEDHSGLVHSVNFSSDNRWVATGSEDRSVRVWETSTGYCRITIQSHRGSIYSVALSPDSTRVISGSIDCAEVWDVVTGQSIYLIHLHGPVHSVAFSPSRNWVAAGSRDDAIVYDLVSGNYILRIHDDRQNLNAIAFSPEGERFAVGFGSGITRIYTWAGPVFHEFRTPNFSHVSFDVTGSYLNTDSGILSCYPTMDPGPLYRGYALSIDGRWISWNDQNCLWLPLEYRKTCSTVMRNKVIIGCASGDVLIFGFDGTAPPMYNHRSKYNSEQMGLTYDVFRG